MPYTEVVAFTPPAIAVSSIYFLLAISSSAVGAALVFNLEPSAKVVVPVNSLSPAIV